MIVNEKLPATSDAVPLLGKWLCYALSNLHLRVRYYFTIQNMHNLWLLRAIFAIFVYPSNMCLTFSFLRSIRLFAAQYRHRSVFGSAKLKYTLYWYNCASYCHSVNVGLRFCVVPTAIHTAGLNATNCGFISHLNSLHVSFFNVLFYSHASFHYFIYCIFYSSYKCYFSLSVQLTQSCSLLFVTAWSVLTNTFDLILYLYSITPDWLLHMTCLKCTVKQDSAWQTV